jgi:hypothetical protein
MADRQPKGRGAVSLGRDLVEEHRIDRLLMPAELRIDTGSGADGSLGSPTRYTARPVRCPGKRATCRSTRGPNHGFDLLNVVAGQSTSRAASACASSTRPACRRSAPLRPGRTGRAAGSSPVSGRHAPAATVRGRHARPGSSMVHLRRKMGPQCCRQPPSQRPKSKWVTARERR